MEVTTPKLEKKPVKFSNLLRECSAAEVEWSVQSWVNGGLQSVLD